MAGRADEQPEKCSRGEAALVGCGKATEKGSWQWPLSSWLGNWRQKCPGWAKWETEPLDTANLGSGESEVALGDEDREMKRSLQERGGHTCVCTHTHARVHAHVCECYSAMKKEKILPSATRMDLEGIMLTEIRETQIPYDLKKNKLVDTKNTLMFARGRGRGVHVCVRNGQRWLKGTNFSLQVSTRDLVTGTWWL